MPESPSMQTREAVLALRDFMNSRILGQARLCSRMLIALLADGHILVEGPPGLAKTRAVKTLASGVQGDFQRIQFTPDLLPADLTGTEVYRPQDSSFSFQRGPLMHHVIVADEINRAPAKVQSALLEAMEERQITVGNNTYPLPGLYFVMATQNPIEQEGTYPLPESQLDRFLLKITIDYPEVDSEVEIMRQVRKEARQAADLAARQGAQTTSAQGDNIPMSQAMLFSARAQILQLHIAEPVEQYIAQLVNASRYPQPYSQQLADWIEYGASPRASLAFDRCSRALAWLEGRDYVSPEDVQQLAHEVLRHRILLTYQAEADGVSIDTVIDELLAQVPVA
ncbi:MAG TPA: MoxR family ATPase [Gammaproteobacteria bacterium]|nr:MoxR family ATPase [Gammaproteobacteria bacterium]